MIDLFDTVIPFKPLVNVYNKGSPDSSALCSVSPFPFERPSWDEGLTDVLGFLTSRLSYLESLDLSYVRRFYDFANTQALALDLVDYSQFSIRQFNKVLGLFLMSIQDELDVSDPFPDSLKNFAFRVETD